MILRRILNDEFEKIFAGVIVLDADIETKLHAKHKVYRDDLEDALGDPYKIILMPFLVTRLFHDGNLYIITAYWADPDLQNIYYTESEALRDE